MKDPFPPLNPHHKFAPLDVKLDIRGNPFGQEQERHRMHEKLERDKRLRLRI